MVWRWSEFNSGHRNAVSKALAVMYPQASTEFECLQHLPLSGSWKCERPAGHAGPHIVYVIDGKYALAAEGTEEEILTASMFGRLIGEVQR